MGHHYDIFPSQKLDYFNFYSDSIIQVLWSCVFKFFGFDYSIFLDSVIQILWFLLFKFFGFDYSSLAKV